MMAGNSSHIHFKGNRRSSNKRNNEEDKFVFFTPVSEKISIKESILQLDHVRLQRNLAKGDLLGDGLFHAISAGSVAAVEIICGFYKSQLGDIALQELVNCYPTGTEFLSVATPLQLAAENDDLRISQILVNCGAKLPSLSDALSESTTDELARGLIRFHWYKAATSPALILLTEANPFGRAFQLAFELSRSGYEPRPRFSQDVQRLCGNLEDLLCAILSKARTKCEVYAVLETGSNYNNEDTSPNVSKQKTIYSKWETSALPRGLKTAIRLDFKKFVAHSYSQLVVTEKTFKGEWLDWRTLPKFMFYLLSVLVFLGTPILSLVYALLPCRRIEQLMETPYVRFLTDVGADFLFLTLVVLSNINVSYNVASCPSEFYLVDGVSCVAVNYKYWPLGGRLLIISAIVLGEVIWAFSNLYHMGFRTWARKVWTWIDIVQILFYSSSLAMYVATTIINTGSFQYNGRVQQNTSRVPPSGGMALYENIGGILVDRDVFETSREFWGGLDPSILAEVMFAVGNILTFQRIMYLCVFFSFFGPLVIAIGTMGRDVFRFCLISALTIASFAIGFTQLYAPYTNVLQNCNELGADPRYCVEGDNPFNSWGSSMYALFWSILGDAGFQNSKFPTNLYIVESVGKTLYACFIIISGIILLNMLIATMSNTYSRVEENVDIEWKYARTRLLEEYLGNRPNRPPPFNVFPSVRICIKLTKKLLSFISGWITTFKMNFSKDGTRVIMGNSRGRKHKTCSTDQGTARSESGCPDVVTQRRERNKLIKLLVERYINTIITGDWLGEKGERNMEMNRRTSSASIRRRSSIAQYYESNLQFHGISDAVVYV